MYQFLFTIYTFSILFIMEMHSFSYMFLCGICIYFCVLYGQV